MTDVRRIVFVCTGNICRSPMAEAIARDFFGEDGVVFESAGVRAVVDAPATPTAAVACREIDVDLAGHRARQLDEEMAESADRIVVMTGDHRNRVLRIAPGVADRLVLLRPDGMDVEDPYGFDLDVYRATRDEIADALRQSEDALRQSDGL